MYSYSYPRPAYTVDAALLYRGNILLIKRGKEPYKGQWALPGGFMEMDETPETAVARELFEETAVDCQNLQQFKTYGAIDRDPRHRTISTVFYYQWPSHQSIETTAGDDAAAVQWFSLNDLPALAFDHQLIIKELVDFLGLQGV
jgi:8-oxo-dGTP diphosphatase